MPNENTRDLSNFGFRELGLAADLLNAAADNLYADQEQHHMIQAVEFNPNSGEVFLVNDEDCVVYMLNENKKLEPWDFCPECQAEGFISNLQILDGSTDKTGCNICND